MELLVDIFIRKVEKAFEVLCDGNFFYEISFNHAERSAYPKIVTKCELLFKQLKEIAETTEIASSGDTSVKVTEKNSNDLLAKVSTK